MLSSLVIEQTNPCAKVPHYKTALGNTSFNNFIKSYPRGAYTGMRTVEKHSIMELRSHCQRIASSLALLRFSDNNTIEDAIQATMANFKDMGELENQLLPMLRCGLSYYYEKNPTVEESKVSVVVSYSEEATQHRCKVQTEIEMRNTPCIKDSQWVRDRARLENQKPEDINEVLLTDNEGNIYEGMASNFYAVQWRNNKPVVVSASLEHVLLGTVMKIVLFVCQEHGIDYVWEFPRLQDAKDGAWEGCFLTSE
ncbi:aminotransferase [Spinellus fusiger]|nr:aminotransferase [Spinellus fusiger]